MFILDYVSWTIGAFGVLVIAWGCAVSGWRFVRFEFRRMCGAGRCSTREGLRHQLGSYLLLGLEFLIAADIIQTIRHPDLQEIAVLASIVAIRTVISHFVDRELADGTSD